MAVTVIGLVLSSCAGPPKRVATPAAPPGVKIGKPYQVFGVWYYPADTRDYDETGVASWYGPGFHALATANGETYDQQAITAAHKTLPMPSWVEVENLDNGRRLTVRINDRGPFVAGRIIDLSRASAQLLGVDGPGLARVRVRRVYPQGMPRPGPAPAALPPIAIAAAPVDAPIASVALPPSTATPPASIFIQVAALADAGRAAWLAGFLGELGTARVEPTGTGLHRVRLGPFVDAATAAATLSRVHAAGYSEARVVPAPR